ncbi:NAD(P)H-dependent oxidoreductase [Acinetobacter sp. ANC 4636]
MNISNSIKKIVVINGHPSVTSFNHALAHAYVDSAAQQGIWVDVIEIGQLNFDLNLKYGYEKRMNLEPDLVEAWEKIMAADHLVWIFPVWWGGLPAITKGFIDRVFLPSMAFSYYDKSNRIRGHLQNKTARIVTTLDQSGWTYKWYFGEPSTRQLKQATLQFCGITKVKTNYIGPIRGASAAQREKWVQSMVKMAQQDGHSLLVKV